VLLIDSGEETRDRLRHYSSIIGGIGKALANPSFPHSERASLRRYGCSNNAAGEAAAFRLLIGFGARLETMRATEMRGWLWLIHCMSILSGANRDPHSSANEARPGHVLQRAGYSELRLSRLLDARGDACNTLLERAIRWATRLGEPMNWSKVAPLLLSRDPESSWAENARLAISRDFFLSAARNGPGQKEAIPAQNLRFQTLIADYD
jgi:CRISPR system Cascade subunit CasB